MTNRVHEEVDLFEVFAILWGGKRLISGFMVAALLTGAALLQNQSPQYLSKLNYTLDNAPPFFTQRALQKDFEEAFFSPDVFESWKADRQTSFAFEDISRTQNIEGVLLAKTKGQLLNTFEKGKNGATFIAVKTNDLSIVNDVHAYADYINETLKDRYIQRVTLERDNIEARYGRIAFSDDKLIENLIYIDRYISTAEQGDKPFTVNRPTMPVKTSPNSKIILVLSLVLGSLTGVLFVFLRNAIQNRQGKIATT